MTVGTRRAVLLNGAACLIAAATPVALAIAQIIDHEAIMQDLISRRITAYNAEMVRFANLIAEDIYSSGSGDTVGGLHELLA